MKSRTNANISVIPKEVVTVTVSASEGTVSDYKIQIIDSDSNVMYIQTTSNATYKIPYGTQYTVKASPVDGFLTPPMQTYTASQSTRSIDVVYEADMKGVFIQDIYGRLYTQDEWDGTQIANGIAVLADECQFVMAFDVAKDSDCPWGDNSKLISGITTTLGQAEAILDYNGKAQTDVIIKALGDATYPTAYGYLSYAAKYCKEYVFPNGKNGYLGAAGEWQVFLNNKDEILNALLKCGHSLEVYAFWTSTQADSSSAWYGTTTGEWNRYNKASYNDPIAYAYAFTPVILPDDIITFYINITKYSCVKGTTWGQWCKSAFNTDGWYVDSDGSTIRWDRMIDMGIIEYVDGVSATDIISGEGYFRNEKEM